MVLFLDSGIGGLVYLEEFQRHCQSYDLAYLADTAFFPYGEKEPDAVRERVVSLVTHIHERYPLQAVVIACNTASVAALSALRSALSIPVIGVVPAVKPAAGRTRTGQIVVLATNATAHDPYTEDLVARFAAYASVTLLGVPELVQAAEAQFYRSSEPGPDSCGPLDSVFSRAVLPQLPQDTDVIVLACTHFVRYRQRFAQLLPTGIAIVDSLSGVIQQLTRVLGDDGSEKQRKEAETSEECCTFFHTAPLSHSHTRVLPENWIYENITLSGEST